MSIDKVGSGIGAQISQFFSQAVGMLTGNSAPAKVNTNTSDSALISVFGDSASEVEAGAGVGGSYQAQDVVDVSAAGKRANDAETKAGGTGTKDVKTGLAEKKDAAQKALDEAKANGASDKEIANLQVEVNKVETEIKKTELEEQQASLTDQRDAAQKALDEAKANGASDDDIAELQSRVDDFDKELETVGQGLEDVAKVQEQRAKVAEKKEELALQEAKQKELEQKKADAQKAVEDAIARGASREEIEELQNKVSDIDKELLDVADKIKGLNGDIDDLTPFEDKTLEAKQKGLQNDIEDLNSKIGKKHEELDIKAKEKEDLEKEKEQLEAELKKAEEEGDEAKIKELQEKLGENAAKLEQVGGEMEALEGDIKDLEGQRDSKKTDLDSVNQQMEDQKAVEDAKAAARQEAAAKEAAAKEAAAKEAAAKEAAANEAAAQAANNNAEAANEGGGGDGGAASAANGEGVGATGNGGGTTDTTSSGRTGATSTRYDFSKVSDKDMAAYIDKHLQEQGSPAAGQGAGEMMVKYGKENNVDPLALLAIAGHETQYGKLGVGVNGMLGVGAYDSDPNNSTRNPEFSGIENQISKGAKTFANLRSKGGASADDDMAKQTAAVNKGGWATDTKWHEGVDKIYDQITADAAKELGAPAIKKQGLDAMFEKLHSMEGMVGGNPEVNKFTLRSGLDSGSSAWCAAFCTNVLEEYGIMNFKGCDNYNWCPSVVSWAKGQNLWEGAGSGYRPQPGDPILFEFDHPSNGNADHIGMVEYVDDNGYIHCIEGNYNNVLKFTTYAPNDPDIYGYVNNNAQK